MNFKMFGAHHHRFGTGLFAAAGIALLAVAFVRAIGQVLRHAMRIAGPAAAHYVKWFWRLPITAKIAITVGEVILLQVAIAFVPVGALERHEIVDVSALGLVGLLLVGILFGRVGARAR